MNQGLFSVSVTMPGHMTYYAGTWTEVIRFLADQQPGQVESVSISAILAEA